MSDVAFYLPPRMPHGHLIVSGVRTVQSTSALRGGGHALWIWSKWLNFNSKYAPASADVCITVTPLHYCGASVLSVASVALVALPSARPIIRTHPVSNLFYTLKPEVLDYIRFDTAQQVLPITPTCYQQKLLLIMQSAVAGWTENELSIALSFVEIECPDSHGLFLYWEMKCGAKPSKNERKRIKVDSKLSI